MERLTKHSKQTSHENGICCTHFRGPECLEVGGNCAMNCKWEEAAWSRLAAYEDTGLTPEEVDMDREAAEQLRQLCQGCDLDRLEELAEADRAGRLEVLPCKVGDTVYTLRRTFDGADVVGEKELWWDDIPQLGKTVFITREEAEVALEAMKDD